MSREKSEKDVRNVPITVRLNEEEHEKLKQCASVRSRIYAPVMQRKRPAATARERILGVAEYTL